MGELCLTAARPRPYTGAYRPAKRIDSPAIWLSSTFLVGVPRTTTLSLDLQVSNCRLQHFRGDAQYLVAGILCGGKDGRPHRIGRLTPAGTTTVRHGIGIIMYDVHRLR